MSMTQSLPIRKVTPAAEQHYSSQEIANMLGVSLQTVIRMFEHEPGVLVINNSRRTHARRYRTLRIPRSVMERVHRSMEVA